MTGLLTNSVWKPELPGESNGYTTLTDGGLGADQRYAHSSDDEDQEEEKEQEAVQEEEEEEEEQAGGGAGENDNAALDCSGSRPLLLDSEEEEEEEEQLSELPRHLPQQPLAHPPPSTPSHQPPPAARAHNHSHSALHPAQGGGDDVLPDVFSKAPFRIAQEAAADPFANAPFSRPPSTVQLPPDVFLQAPFGRRKEVTSQSPQTRPSQHSPQARPHHAHPVTPEQALLGQVAPQPFRPQALAKYSRHFEGPVPQQQPVATLRVVSSLGRQAVGSAPAGPLHSWTSEVSGGGGDPFVSAPFHLKAPQEKP